MTFSRKLLALLLLTALLCAALAPASSAPAAAVLLPLCVFCLCLSTVRVRRVFERCDLPSSPFCPQLASRAPPVR